MKQLAIILLFCLSATAQTYDCTLEATGVSGPCKLVDPKPVGAGGCPECELEKRVDKLDQRAAMQFKVLIEYSLMQAELEDLHNERVNCIMHKHLLAIGEYVKQMKALDAKPPGQ